MKRHETAVRQFRRDKLCRLLLVTVVGLVLAHLLPMSQSSVFVGLYPASIVVGMDRFAFAPLLKRCAMVLLGAIAGALVIDMLGGMIVAVTLLTYGLFLGVLKLFALGREVASAITFVFTYSLGTIYSSYPGPSMKLAATQDYLIQVILVFFIVWGSFALFPHQNPDPPPVLKRPAIGNAELAAYALVWLAIWLFFMFFEWRFALFAFLSFVGAFNYFERDRMKKIVRENIIAHVSCCSLVSLASLLLLGIIDNFAVHVLGILLLAAPIMYYAVYPPRPELAYRCRTMVQGFLVPMALYVSIEHAAVYQSMLRAALIILLMLLLWLVIEYFHHGGRMIRKLKISRKRRRTRCVKSIRSPG